MKRLDSNAHSVFLLYYHLIMVVKYRRKVIDDSVSKFINAYKSASSRLLKKEYPEIRAKLWKEAFWSQSFCLLTAGRAPIETIRSYIESQGEKRESSRSSFINR